MNKISEILTNVPWRFNIIDKCNLSCYGCSKDGFKNYSSSRIMDPSLVKKFLKLMQKNGHSPKECKISGGEPTLHPKIETIITIMRDHSNKVYLITNGIHPISKKSYENIDIVNLHLDSANLSTWRKITKGTKNQYNELLKNISVLYAGPKTSISTVIHKGINDNNQEIRGILNLCIKNNLKEVRFFEFAPYNGENTDNVALDAKFLKEKDIDVIPIKPEIKWQGNSVFNPNTYFRLKGTDLTIRLYKPVCTSGNCHLCHIFNFVQMVPYNNGKGIGIIPCWMDGDCIDLTATLINNDTKKLATTIEISRHHLSKKNANYGYEKIYGK